MTGTEAAAKDPNQLELNKGDNFSFLLDRSGSMGSTDTPTGQSRIDFAKEKAILFAEKASEWDTDGIDLIEFGSDLTTHWNVNAGNAKEIIGKVKATQSATMTHEAIAAAFKRHKETKSKQTVCFVVTDGAPSDPEKTAKTIAGITNELADEHEFAISFLTVGKRDAALEAYLTTLDDDLKSKYGAKHDIVDVKELEKVDFMKAFEDALHD